MPTLYVKEQGALLARERDRIVARKAGEVLLEMPALYVDRVMVFGNVHLTTPLTAFLLNQGIDTVFLSSRGRYRGRLQAAENGNTRLRRRQYEISSDRGFCLSLSKVLVKAKMRNQSALLARRKLPPVRRAASGIRDLVGRTEKASDLDALRGYEGTAARVYFGAFPHLLQSGFSFPGRVRRPPTDPVNILLSLGYTLLFADMLSALYAVGFDPFVGFFHEERTGHAALASDLIEEFRTPVVDVVVLSLCNRRIVTSADFRRESGGRIRLNDRALNLVFQDYERRMETRVTVPSAGRQLAYRAGLEQQARCLADVLLGKQEAYVPFQMRQ